VNNGVAMGGILLAVESSWDSRLQFVDECPHGLFEAAGLSGRQVQRQWPAVIGEIVDVSQVGRHGLAAGQALQVLTDQGRLARTWEPKGK
jgi:hypothetical protein